MAGTCPELLVATLHRVICQSRCFVFGVLDAACARSFAGAMWPESFKEQIEQHDVPTALVPDNEGLSVLDQKKSCEASAQQSLLLPMILTEKLRIPDTGTPGSHNDGGLLLCSPSVGIQLNLLQNKLVVCFSDDDHCLSQCDTSQFCWSCEENQFNRFFSRNRDPVTRVR